MAVHYLTLFYHSSFHLKEKQLRAAPYLSSVYNEPHFIFFQFADTSYSILFVTITLPLKFINFHSFPV
jgi:hypothetical protein